MKYILIFIFLFIPSVSAKNDAISCSYKTEGKVVNFGYYIDENGTGNITNFIIDGKKYNNYNNLLNGDLTLECPKLNSIKYYGNDDINFYITKTDDDFRSLIAQGDIVYDANGDVIGQVEKYYRSTNNNSTNYTHYDSKEINGSVSGETRKQMINNIKAYSSNDCTYIEKTAIAEYFFANDFYSVSNFSSSNTFMYKNEYITLSSTCANDAKNLYNSILYIRNMLSDYVDGGGDVNSINYLSLEGSYYSGYNALTTPWYDNSTSSDVCDVISADIRKILNELFNTLRLICVILVVFLINLDLMQTLSKKDDSEIKKMINRSIKRVVALVLMLLLPFLINFILDLINGYFGNSYINVNGECVKAITGG